MKARVKWFNNEKGYGFIENGGEDIFIHYSQIIKEGFKTLEQNELVSFDLVHTDKGLQAKNVLALENREVEDAYVLKL